METPSPQPAPLIPYYESTERPFDYKYLLLLVKRNSNLIITFLIIGITLATIYIFRLPDRYAATAQILLERPTWEFQAGTPVPMPDIWAEDYYNTQKEIMLGPTVLREAVEEGKLLDYFKVLGIEEAASQVRGYVQVKRIQDSRLFNIVATSLDPQFSTTLANAVTRAYIRKNFEDQLYFSKELLGWVPEEGSQIVTVEDPFGKIRQISRDELIDSLPSIRTDPTIRELEGKKNSLEAELTTLLKQYREKHPLVVKAQASLRFLEESIKSEKIRVVESLKQQATGRGQISIARIVEEAEVPQGPSGPRRGRILLVVAGVELLVIFIGIYLWDYFDDTVHSPDDLQRRGITLPFLGPIPLIKESGGTHEERFLISHYKPRSEFAESFRYLRVAINFSAPPETLKSLVFTSALPGEGKSFVAHNVAVSLAQDANRTLLLDADLRNPVAHRVYRMENRTGLSNYLTSDIEFDTVVQQTPVENLWVALSGPSSPNPAEILGSKRMIQFLEIARKRFDRIIVDAPPLTGIGDALVLGSITTHVILVIGAAKTPAEILLKSKEVLEKSGIRIIGVVLNRVDIEKERYGGYYKYYYQSYTRYYSPSPEPHKE